MPLEVRLEARGLILDDATERRVHRHLDALERMLVHHPEPRAELLLTWHQAQRRVSADLRVRLSPLGAHLVSRQDAETPDLAARLAIAAVARQLERRTASQRGEPSFGVPSRREPRSAPVSIEEGE